MIMTGKKREGMQDKGEKKKKNQTTTQKKGKKTGK